MIRLDSRANKETPDKMRNLIIMLLVGMMGLGLAIDHAEARRLGGGKSFGSFSRSTDSAPTRSAAPTGSQQQAGARAPSRAGGMMGGLLAGGLLAALFFGGAFDELRLMDILLIAGLAFLAFRFLARRRPAMADGHEDRLEMVSRPQSSVSEASGHSRGSDGLAPPPDWFDKKRFLNDAKEHFMNLQRAWDNNDFSSIQEYVTPELYNLLHEERKHHSANNRTEIVRLLVELGDVREYDKLTEATVIFHGIIDENGDHNEFNETWHLVRDMRNGAPWHIQGIEQNSSA